MGNPERPTIEEAIQEILRAGGLANCPMCSRNDERRWRGVEGDNDSNDSLRLVCTNCHYIVSFDCTSLYLALKKRTEVA
jgi:hypothetical protein